MNAMEIVIVYETMAIIMLSTNIYGISENAGRAGAGKLK